MVDLSFCWMLTCTGQNNFMKSGYDFEKTLKSYMTLARTALVLT
jgi:hypothetical protein